MLLHDCIRTMYTRGVGLMVGIMADLVVGLVVRSEDERHGEH